jgi:hypothetical protein
VLPGAVVFGREGELAVFRATDPGSAVTALASGIAKAGDRLTSLQVEAPTLEERFMELIEENV